MLCSSASPPRKVGQPKRPLPPSKLCSPEAPTEQTPSQPVPARARRVNRSPPGGLRHPPAAPGRGRRATSGRDVTAPGTGRGRGGEPAPGGAGGPGSTKESREISLLPGEAPDTFPASVRVSTSVFGVALALNGAHRRGGAGRAPGLGGLEPAA